MAKSRGRVVKGATGHRVIDDQPVTLVEDPVDNRSAIPAARVPPTPGDTSGMNEDEWWAKEAQRVHDEDQIALRTGLVPGINEEPLMPQELNPDGTLAEVDDDTDYLDGEHRGVSHG